MSSDLAIMKDTSWETPYIHGKDYESGEMMGTNEYESILIVYLNSERVELTPQKFLHEAWTKGFNTPCSICKEHFDLAIEFSVRLLSLGPHANVTDPLTQNLPPLHVRNYHLKCLKTSNVRYLPVSHPWHSSVAEAYAHRTFNAKAAQTSYETPLRTLMAIQRRFGSDCVLWHDYISVPQWEDDLRGSAILPQIFKIFEASGSSILHLGQQPPSEVVSTPTVEMIKRHNAGLQRFFDAHLFTRLWPVVEFDRAGEAYIMSDQYRILEPKFTTFAKGILNIATMGDTKTPAGNDAAFQWIEHLPLFIRERQEKKCFGYVFDMIAKLGCRSFRDKFIGASELLGIADYPQQLPIDVQDACLWLAERQIQNNDPSALLLRPSQEPQHAKASWLKGHQSIRPDMWGWGVEIQAGNKVPRVRHHSVHLDLRHVGNVTHNLTWDMSVDHSCESSSSDLQDLLSSPQISADSLIERLETINPRTLLHSEHNDEELETLDLQFRVSSSNLWLTTLRHIYDQASVGSSEGRLANLPALHDDMMSLLALSASDPVPTIEHFAKLGPSKLRQQLCDPSERHLLLVSCPHCLTRSSIRAHLWKQPTMDTQLHLIPGLTYQYTAVGGVGILLDKGHIIGRTRFCAAPCICDNDVTVEII